MLQLKRIFFLAGLGLVACAPTATQPDRLVVPCELGEFRWGMTESELKQLRPDIHWSSSDNRYHEELVGCDPFIARASYDVDRDRGLTQIHLSRHKTVSRPGAFDDLIPGFLYGCHNMWGTPDTIEAFQQPGWDEGEYWHIGMSWDLPWGSVRASYSSPDALFPQAEQWWASFEVHISNPSFLTPPPWTQGNPDPEIVNSYSRAFPSDEHVPEVILD